MTGRPTFAFDGREVPFREGQSVAAALTGAGIRAFRRNEAGNSRGLFCGIGVCQDCVVEIDGAANQRACVARAAVGMRVRTQVPRPVPPEPIPCDVRSSEPQRRRVDVVIVGGGAGGLSAAIAAARCGADVLVLDERSVAGGQYFKQTAPGLAAPPLDAQQRRGAALVEEALRSGVQILPGAMVWSVFAGFVVHAEVNGGSLRVEARAMVVATGAYERPLQVPGWDLPGVMTTGAAQTLWRSYRTLPGRRIAIAGSGPLNLQVALELRRGGAEIRLLAESAPPPWLRVRSLASAAVAAPRLVAQGVGMQARFSVLRSRVAFGARLAAVEQQDGELAVVVREARGEARRIPVDVVCVNDGFQPQNELMRLLGAAMRFDAAAGELIPLRSDAMETTVRGLFAAGDCCGLGGALAAMAEGRIAGAAAAAAAGCATHPLELRGVRRALARHRRFQNALWRIYDRGGQGSDRLEADMALCRCEGVTRRDVDAALAAGVVGIGGLKSATRLGMGPCQGRYCMIPVARYLAMKRGTRIDEEDLFAHVRQCDRFP